MVCCELEEGEEEGKLEEAKDEVINLPGVSLECCRGNKATQDHAPLPEGGQSEVGVCGGRDGINMRPCVEQGGLMQCGG